MHVLGTTIAAFLVAGATSALAQSSDACAMLALVNNLRLSLNLQPLQLEQGLSQVAAALNVCEQASGQLSHECGGSVETRMAYYLNSYASIQNGGENTAYAYPSGTVQSVYNQFFNSAEHYANMVNPEFRYFGYTSSPNYFTQDFASFSAGTPRVVSCGVPQQSSSGSDLSVSAFSGPPPAPATAPASARAPAIGPMVAVVAGLEGSNSTDNTAATDGPVQQPTTNPRRSLGRCLRQ